MNQLKEDAKRKLEDMKKITLVVDGTCKEVKRSRNMLQRGKHMINLGIMGRRKLRSKPEHSYIIEMMFSNGTSKTFVITTDKNTFTMKGKTYYLYYEESWFNLSMNQYELKYHEGSAVPINREIIKTGDENYFTVTPENLKDLIKFEYVKVLTGSGSFEKWVKILIIVCGATLLGVILLALRTFQNVVK